MFLEQATALTIDVGDVAFPELSKHHYAALNDKGHFRFPECVVRGASGSFFRHAINVYSKPNALRRRISKDALNTHPRHP